MIVDTHVHIWEIDPPRYPVGPTAPGWKSEPDEPATADELIADMDANGVDRSVIVQTSYFRYTRVRFGEGRRVFRMAPIHHHFEKLGWPETKVVTRFWILGILCAMLAFGSLKIR